jgi:hypothetical protein
MVQQIIDQTAQERLDYALAKINANFTEVYALAGAGGPGSFTTVTASGEITGQEIKLDTGTKTATAVAGAATLNKSSGVVTSEALTTAAGADYTLTLTNSTIAAADVVLASVQLTSAGGTPTIASVTPAAGSVVIVVQNIHASAAFAAAIKVAFAVLKA